MKNSFSVLTSLLIINFVAFILLHVIHFRFFTIDVVLSAVVFDVICATLLTSSLYYIFYRKTFFLVFTSSIISILIGLGYGILIPTMVDRSITVNLLLSLNGAQKEAILLDDLSDKLLGDHVLNKRYKEQKEAGNIIIKDGEVELTKKGKIISKLFLYNKLLLGL